MLSSNNIPTSFGLFTDNGDGTGEIVILPTSSHIGEYTNIQIIASDDIDNNIINFNLTVVEDFPSNILSKEQQEFIIYPNPLTGREFKIILPKESENTPINIDIVSTNGAVVFSEKVSTSNDFISINLHKTISKGIYIIRLKSNNQIVTNRLIIN